MPVRIKQDRPLNPLSEALLRAGVMRRIELMKGKTKYACGCVLIERENKGKRRFSIFPACDREKCAVRDVVKQNAISDKIQRRETGSIVRLPHSASESAIQVQRRNRT